MAGERSCVGVPKREPGPVPTVLGVPGGTRLRQEANFDSRAPTFRNKSDTMFKADIRVDGDSSGNEGCWVTDARPLPLVIPLVSFTWEDSGFVTLEDLATVPLV